MTNKLLGKVTGKVRHMQELSQGGVEPGGGGYRGLTIQNTRNFTKTLADKRIFFCELRIFEDFPYAG